MPIVSFEESVVFAAKSDSDFIYAKQGIEYRLVLSPNRPFMYAYEVAMKKGMGSAIWDAAAHRDIRKTKAWGISVAIQEEGEYIPKIWTLIESEWTTTSSQIKKTMEYPMLLSLEKSTSSNKEITALTVLGAIPEYDAKQIASVPFFTAQEVMTKVLERDAVFKKKAAEKATGRDNLSSYQPGQQKTLEAQPQAPTGGNGIAPSSGVAVPIDPGLLARVKSFLKAEPGRAEKLAQPFKDAMQVTAFGELTRDHTARVVKWIEDHERPAGQSGTHVMDPLAADPLA